MFGNNESSFPPDDFRSKNYRGNWQKKFIDGYVDSIFTKGIDETHKEFSEGKKEHMPDSLYKFYAPSIYSLANIQSGIVFLSSPRRFNDPFDSFICVDDKPYIKFSLLKGFDRNGMKSIMPSSETLTEDEFDRLKYAPINSRYNPELGHVDDFDTILRHISINKSDDFQSQVRSLFVAAMRECERKVDLIRNIPFRITCFSNFDDEAELCRNTTMWSHYAENHAGFCVKYSTKSNKTIFKDIINCGLFPVIYTTRVPKLTLNDFKNLKLSGDDLLMIPSVLKKAYKAFITKSKYWNYEKEWRLLINEQNEVHLSDNTIPFFKIEAIYLGCRIDSNIKKVLVRFAELNKVDIYLAKQSNERFQLDFCSVTSKTLRDDEYYSKLYRYNRIEDERTRKRNLSILSEKF
jgi:hypothetical protein